MKYYAGRHRAGTHISPVAIRMTYADVHDHAYALSPDKYPRYIAFNWLYAHMFSHTTRFRFSTDSNIYLTHHMCFHDNAGTHARTLTQTHAPSHTHIHTHILTDFFLSSLSFVVSLMFKLLLCLGRHFNGIRRHLNWSDLCLKYSLSNKDPAHL